MKPLCDIAIRFRIGDILVNRDGQPDEVFKAAAAYDIHGKKLGLVTGVMDGGASAGLMHGAPAPGDGERWQWLQNGRERVEKLLGERPELEMVSGLYEMVYDRRNGVVVLVAENLVNPSYWRRDGEKIVLILNDGNDVDVTRLLKRNPPKFILREMS